MSLLDYLRELFTGKVREPEGYILTVEQVENIARIALKETGLDREVPLTLNRILKNDDQRIWQVCSSTMGSWWELEIRDSDGKVLHSEQRGVR